MSLTDEEKQNIKDTMFPDILETTGRGRPRFSVVYDKDPTSQVGNVKFILNKEVFPFLLAAIYAMKEGISYRQVSEFTTTNCGSRVTHETCRKLFSSICELYPAWKGHRAQSNKSHGANNPQSNENKNKAKVKKTQKKTILKRKINNLQKEYDILTAPPLKDPLLETEGMEVVGGAIFRQKKGEAPVIFKPNVGPQTEFLSSTEREVLYGGAAGGGKSYALIADPVRYFGNKNFNGILLRRTNDELRELIWKTQELYPQVYKGAKWSERKSQWNFPSGARLWLTYLDRDEDVLRYQGQAFCWIGFDELTQNPTPFAWDYMRSRLRTTDPTLPLCMRSTTNPGGPGHGWVKKMFIDPAPANKKFCATDLESGNELRYPDTHKKAGEVLFFRRFIPATLKDNPYLYDEGAYEANLLSLPSQQRKQLLEGDWMTSDGAAFTEFSITQHVVEPFEIPHTWRIFRSCDFGYSSYSAVHWFAVDPAYETLYVFRELYVSKNTAGELGRKVVELEQGEKISYGVLDSSTWHKRGHTGPSIAEEMIAQGCRWRPADRNAGSRVAGKNRLHELLKYDAEIERPGIQFFNTCRQIIADLQVIPSDPKGGDDIDVRYASDHTYDSIRYGIMSRPKAKSVFDFAENMGKTDWQPFDKVFGY